MFIKETPLLHSQLSNNDWGEKDVSSCETGVKR